MLADLCGRDEISRAADRAARIGARLHEVLITSGRITAPAYVAALAGHFGIPVLEERWSRQLLVDPDQPTWRPLTGRLELSDQDVVVLDAQTIGPAEISDRIGSLRAEGRRVALATAAVLHAGLVSRRSELLAAAIDGPARVDPARSARSGIWLRQYLALAAGAGMVGGALAVAPEIAFGLIGGLLALPFLLVVGLRVLALAVRMAGPGRPTPALTDREVEGEGLPVYTVLVALYKEARVLPDLVRALKRLDYPPERLDIKIVLEAADEETQAVARALELAPPFELVLVPDRQPRTKPKALNFALQLARGDFLVIFDAEDIPEPDQLRKALAAFRHGPARLGCVQARLSIDNTWESWLTRHFSIEYIALFDGLLPAFDRLRLPVPLGGTSNHFPTRVIRELGAWDAFNVTEDADLGMRLARSGYRCGVIDSCTFEESPHRFYAWLKQRTRWLKGWMQTWLVHMRHPVRLWRELGGWGFLSLNALLGGLILSSLAHPLCLAIIGAEAIAGDVLGAPTTWLGGLFWWISVFNLAAGYGAAMMLAIWCVAARRAWGLLAHVPLLPVYWLCISLAAYRALWQLFRDPFKWEKTEHGLSDRRMTPPT